MIDLPLDILLAILSRSKTALEHKDYTKLLITTTHICQRWRLAVLSLSSLWTKIALDHPLSAEALLARSESVDPETPLLLDVAGIFRDDSPHHNSKIMDALLTCIARTQTLKLELAAGLVRVDSEPQDDTVLLLIRLSQGVVANQLQTLEISASNAVLNSPVYPHYPTWLGYLNFFLGGTLPSLRDVSLCRGAFLSHAFGCPGLSRLDLTVTSLDYLDTLVLLPVLEKSPNLEWLSAACVADTDRPPECRFPGDRRIVHLPRLRELHLVNLPHALHFFLLRAIKSRCRLISTMTGDAFLHHKLSSAWPSPTFGLQSLQFPNTMSLAYDAQSIRLVTTSSPEPELDSNSDRVDHGSVILSTSHKFPHIDWTMNADDRQLRELPLIAILETLPLFLKLDFLVCLTLDQRAFILGYCTVWKVICRAAPLIESLTLRGKWNHLTLWASDGMLVLTLKSVSGDTPASSKLKHLELAIEWVDGDGWRLPTYPDGAIEDLRVGLLTRQRWGMPLRSLHIRSSAVRVVDSSQFDCLRALVDSFSFSDCVEP